MTRKEIREKMMNSAKMLTKINNNLVKTGEMDEESFKFCCGELKENANSYKESFIRIMKSPGMKWEFLRAFFGRYRIAKYFNNIDTAGIFKIAFGEEVIA